MKIFGFQKINYEIGEIVYGNLEENHNGNNEKWYVDSINMRYRC